MAQTTTIEWTEATWNPVRGCSAISPGCARCYAARIAARFSKPGLPYEGLAKMTTHGPRWTGEVLCVEEHLFDPLQQKRPKTFFVNSMSDLFHEAVEFDFIHRVFKVMQGAHWHRFQILTKRSERLAKLGPHLPWPENVWMGVSVENDDYTSRIDHLRGTGARIKFLSLEPLLGPLPNLNLRGIDWVIVGGESGPGARPIAVEWVTDIRDQCQHAGVAFFFKQWGGVNKKRTGRLLEGRTWDELPQQRRRMRGRLRIAGEVS